MVPLTNDCFPNSLDEVQYNPVLGAKMTRKMTAIARVSVTDAATAFYCECEFCNGLFPLDLVAAHVKLGHETESSAQIDIPKRRVFACTDVTDTWYDDDDDENNAMLQPTTSSNGSDQNVVVLPIKAEPNDQISHAITMESDGADYVLDNSGSDGEDLLHAKRKARCRRKLLASDGHTKRVPVVAKRRLVINDGEDSDTNTTTVQSTETKRRRRRRQQDDLGCLDDVADFDYAHMPKWLHEKIFGEFFTTAHGYLDHYVTAMDHMPTPDPHRFPDIPEKFDTRFSVCQTDASGAESVEFRARISEISEAREWLNDYAARSGVKFVLHGRDKARERRPEQQVTRWVCEFRLGKSGKPKTDCPMKIRIVMAPLYQLAGIVITGQHNHCDPDANVAPDDLDKSGVPINCNEVPAWLRKKIHEEFFTTQYGYMEHYVIALNDMPKPDRFPDVPEMYDTRFALEKTDEAGIQSVEFRARIGSLAEAREWMKDYAVRTNMYFDLSRDRIKNKTMRAGTCERRCFRYYCSSRRWGKKHDTIRDTSLNCPIKVRITIAPEYNIAGILITDKHNHPKWADMNVEHANYYWPHRLLPDVRPGDERFQVLQETARDFRGYIGQGMARKEMFDLHEKVLRARPDFKPEMLTDPVYMPNKQMLDSLRSNFECQLQKIAIADGTTVESQAAYVHYRRELAKRGRKSAIAPKQTESTYIPECEDEAIMDFDL